MQSKIMCELCRPFYRNDFKYLIDSTHNNSSFFQYFLVSLSKMNIYCDEDLQWLKNNENAKIIFGRKIERYESQVNTSDFYKTFNLPERFENTRKFLVFFFFLLSHSIYYFVISTQIITSNYQMCSVVLACNAEIYVHFIEQPIQIMAGTHHHLIPFLRGINIFN